MPGPLTTRVLTICDDALGRMVPGPGRDAILQVRQKLAEPLRVAVAGSVSSGKSTLVNALLGQQVAAVDAGECTRVVTWFCYDHHERAEVHLRSGGTKTVALTAGRGLPESLGVDPDDIERLVVWLSNEHLREVSIIDTPGLNTVTEERQAAAADFLGLEAAEGADQSRLVMSEADALIFLTPHVREADVAVLEGFAALFSGTGLTAINAVGVLSKIDKLSSDDDPWPVARRIATRAREQLRTLVSDVIPVIGLLAETANTDQFNEGDANALRGFCGLDELDREDLLLTPEDFLDFPGPDVPRAHRQRLLAMLDLHGIGLAIDALEAGGSGANDILRKLDDESGFGPLRDLVRQLFARRSDLLKAHAGVCDLQRISYYRDDAENGRHLRGLRTPLERIELDAEMHDLKLLEVLHRSYSGGLTLPEDLLTDLEHLALQPTPAAREGLDESAAANEVAAAAAARAAQWGEFAHDARRSPEERRMARDVKEGHELVWGRVAG